MRPPLRSSPRTPSRLAGKKSRGLVPYFNNHPVLNLKLKLSFRHVTQDLEKNRITPDEDKIRDVGTKENLGKLLSQVNNTWLQLAAQAVLGFSPRQPRFHVKKSAIHDEISRVSEAFFLVEVLGLTRLFFFRLVHPGGNRTVWKFPSLRCCRVLSSLDAVLGSRKDLEAHPHRSLAFCQGWSWPQFLFFTLSHMSPHLLLGVCD